MRMAPPASHPAVLAVHGAAAAVSDHQQPATPASFWRQWFASPQGSHFADRVRAFVGALDQLQDVPPSMLTAGDLKAVGAGVERVVECVEAEIDRIGASSGAAPALAQAVYVIRARYEELYRRGATG
jgi:hypothetical protein